jgi:agmatine/peptidylarginine deiminase
MKKQMNPIVFPAEWFPQSGVMLTWPHENTDWNYILDDVTACYVSIAHEIVKHERLLVVCQDEMKVRHLLSDIEDKVIFKRLETNDTWARDHGPITVFVDGEPCLYDFQFNGWGLKFASNLDNQITRGLYGQDSFSSNTGYFNFLHYVLEGGSVESDGCGTLLTTAECLLSKNRNEHLQKEEVENFLKDVFGLKRILWLNHGYLAGDDTDSHIDTLARFCGEDTIAYVQCTDENDEHYVELKAMEEELKTFTQLNGEPYRLVPLPMPESRFEDDFRLPATYANFLIINQAVLMPFYNCPQDRVAQSILQKEFPNHEVVGIDCTSLIRQHGSLHCVTMQFPIGVLK